ncbi:MAG: hypothetical protein QFB87_04245 [Patescibacteria group bacterium]|nr:hypothetical protein [Patescibacteria group bacterium]
MERCQDGGCGFDNRLKYCAQEARDPDGPVAYVLQAIDDLLYDNNLIASDQYSIQVDKQGQIMQRAFTITHFDSRTWILPLTKSSLAISHETNRQLGRESYEITLGWAVEQIDRTSEPFSVKYIIDSYQSGAVQATIEQPDFETGGRHTNALTNYDYDELYKVLDLFAIAQKAERADNARVQAA